MRLKAILCLILKKHKFNYYTDECVRCGKINKTDKIPR